MVMQASDSKVSARELVVLLLLSTLLFSIGSHARSLRSMDDCFYARRGIEMKRNANFFTATVNGRPVFQTPPLQYWILGKSFSLFGENDFAARFPSLLMAMGILLMLYALGLQTVGRSAAITAVGLLLLCPLFVLNARRCMLEIALTFWILATFLLLLRGIRRPVYHLVVGIPLAAAILTKSILGLLPILVFAAASKFSEEIKNSFKTRWLWLGIATGILLGASWSIHQAIIFGRIALIEHYMEQIGARSLENLSVSKILFGYPLILLGAFQPVVLPGVAGAIKIFQREKGISICLVLWIALPILLYSFSSARSGRYIFPIFPALALSAAWWIESFSAKFASLFRRWIIPVCLLIFISLFQFDARLFKEDENHDMKATAPLIKERVPEHEDLTYLGNQYWYLANPLLYYAERGLKQSSTSAPEAIETALHQKSHLLLCDPPVLQQVAKTAKRYEVLAESKRWVLVRLWRKPHKRAER